MTTATKTSQTAQYKGRAYTCLYIGPTKYGRRAHLQFRDGSKDFWVAAELVSVGPAAEESRPSVSGGGASRYGSYATIGARMAERQRRTGWTGCQCGSIEGRPRPSDCESCRFDND